jgi:hypothetical protein
MEMIYVLLFAALVIGGAYLLARVMRSTVVEYGSYPQAVFELNQETNELTVSWFHIPYFPEEYVTHFTGAWSYENEGMLVWSDGGYSAHSSNETCFYCDDPDYVWPQR